MPALHRLRRRNTAERSNLHKRNPLPQLPPGPITLTINRPAPTFIPSPENGASSQQPPPQQPPPPPPSPTSSATPTLSPPSRATTLPPSSPVASVFNNDSPDDSNPTFAPASTPTVSGELSSSGSSTKTIPPGAIVGIVIAGVLLLLTVVVLLVRRSFKQNRMQRRATWLNNGGISNQTMMAAAPAAKSASTFAPAERYPASANTYGASTLPGAGAASMALATVAMADPGGGETSPGYAFADAQAQALSGGAYAISSPPATYNNPAVSPKTVPSVISAGDMAVVKFTFIPSLPDELSISNGEVVKVLQEYDDGWALCVNGRDMQGMVPLECLERGNDAGRGYDASQYGGNGDLRNSRRASSLNIIAAAGQRR